MSLEDITDEKDIDIKWQKPSPPGAGSTVGQRVEYSIAEALRSFFSLFDEPLIEVLSWPLRIVLKVIERSAAEYLGPVIDYATDKMDSEDPMRQLLLKLKSPTGEGAAGMLMGIGAQGGSAGLMSVLEPLFEIARQRAYETAPNRIYDLPTWLQMSFRELPPGVDLTNMSRRSGYPGAWLPYLKELVRLRPSEGELGVMTQRGDLPRADYLAELQARGMSEQEAELAEKLLHIIPGPADLVRMVVREAFSEDIIRQFELDADLPDTFVDWADKVGVDAEWARRYWISHWVLPSLTMGYEMLHRDVITDGELDLLLRMQDVAPYWRPKLKAISYSPYTRVDTRRMYELGVLDEAGILRSYKDQGYDPEKAANMTEFTIRYAQEGEREATRTDIIAALKGGALTPAEATQYLLDIGYSMLYADVYVAKAVYEVAEQQRKDAEQELQDDTNKEREETKSDILGGYKDGPYTREEAQSGLVSIGYASSVAEVMLARVDLQKARELAQEEIKTVQTLYVNRRIDVPQVHERLGKIDLTAAQVEALLETWTITRESRTERPSAAKLLDYYQQGTINEDRLRLELKGHGYADDYIEWQLRDVSLRILEAEAKEQERLLKEQQREEESAFKDERRVALNVLDIQIQERKVYLAQLKLLMLTDPEVMAAEDYKETVAALQAEIAQLQLEKLEYPVLADTG